MDKRPIGVFDSGLGGLTAVRAIIKALLNENIVYLGDTARVPYGPRSKETVTGFAIEDAKFLAKRKVKCIVIACNTASAYSYPEVKREFSIPVFDAISGASEKAVKVSKIKRVGVIGTRGTIASHAYKNDIAKLDKKIVVFEEACPLFVPFIEEGETKGELIGKLVKKYLAPIKKRKVDTLILGCTHYPIIKNLIAREVGPKVSLVDPAEEIAQKLKIFLKNKKLEAPKTLQATRKYYVTDLTDRFIKVAEMFLGEKLVGKIEKVSLE